MHVAPGQVYPQHRVAHSLVAVWVHEHGLGHEDFDLVGHDAELATAPCRCLELGLVIEQAHAEAQGVGPDAGSISLECTIRHYYFLSDRPRHHYHFVLILA